MIDAFLIGVALLASWLQFLWQSLNFWQQATLFVALVLILLWCVRTLKSAFVVWFHKHRQYRRMATVVANASGDDEAFGEFYLELWKTTGLDYTRKEAEQLYEIMKPYLKDVVSPKKFKRVK